ncbi:response regulator [Virgibacillus sp. NKC19-3]|uniref:response regulator n=1 Tax=Virgibacillus saliphilus TaxID=2831674 RepID=UPI001C9A5459|nr:response regulator [Virgibacillus sp. NKC19-3]MBY7141855.1 response regulator [Virgibacillus sp. NKC19-3]
MLNVCIIDDEPLALQYADFLLRKIEGVDVTGTYVNTNDVIHHIQSQHVDAVFLDIHMPTVKGTDLAEYLLNIRPSLHIVFVTAYDEYAVKAFELNAVDYILKPVKQERLEVTIQRIMERKKQERENTPDASAFAIKNLGMLQIYQGHKRVDVKWRTSKAKELFAYFIHHHQHTIPKNELINLLWDNLPWEKANAQLYTAVYQIRKVMQQTGAPITIVSQGEFYNIDLGDHIQIQSHEFKLAAQHLLKDNVVHKEPYFTLLESYQGAYLAGLDYPWAMNERQILHTLWLELIHTLAAYLHHHEGPSSYAISNLKDITRFDPEAVEIIEGTCRM